MFVPFSHTRITDPYWRDLQRLVREKVLPYQWEILNDRVPGAEPSFCVRNFRIAAGETAGERRGMVFQDSDLYKWLEAVAYALALQPDAALQRAADEAVALISRAQQPDGYLNTYYTLVAPKERFRNLAEGHELYCAGHLMEAAVAYRRATGKDALLRVACRFADCIARWFLPESGEARGYPGHPEIELALLALYDETGSETYLRLCRFFLDARGAVPCLRDAEEARGGFTPVWDHMKGTDASYLQDHAPVREQRAASGHAVRAMYLYAAMADLALRQHDPALRAACAALWENTTRRQMYVTGGVGSCANGERFTTDFDLPNDAAYNETCASVGLMRFARRMWQLTDDPACFAVWERALRNGVLAGMSLDGERFFYVNPLQIAPQTVAANPSLQHVAPERPRWYGCACCPPNLARCVLSLGGSLYDRTKDTLTVLCPLAAHVEDGDLTLDLTREGERCLLSLDAPALTLRLRVPEGFDFTCALGAREGDYWVLPHAGGQAAYPFTLSPRVRILRADPRIVADTGRVCVCRGETVYCLEELDNGPDLPALSLCVNDPGFAAHPMAFLPEGLTALTANGVRLHASGWRGAYDDRPLTAEPVRLTLVPYAAWNNRGKGEMTVWMGAHA